MPMPKQFEGKAKKFSSTNQPKHNGRKPKMYNVALKTYNIGLPEWKSVAMYLLQCTKEKLQEIEKKPDTPIWMITICRALYKDAGEGTMETMEEIIRRVWGNPSQIGRA